MTHKLTLAEAHQRMTDAAYAVMEAERAVRIARAAKQDDDAAEAEDLRRELIEEWIYWRAAVRGLRILELAERAKKQTRAR